MQSCYYFVNDEGGRTRRKIRELFDKEKNADMQNGDVDEQVDIVLICNLEESQKGSLPQLSLHLMRPGLWSK
jgi:hypothetical protein